MASERSSDFSSAELYGYELTKNGLFSNEKNFHLEKKIEYRFKIGKSDSVTANVFFRGSLIQGQPIKNKYAWS